MHARPQETLTARAVSSGNLIVARVQTEMEVGAELQANTTITWEVLAGETNSVAVHVPPEWTIQAVEATPAAAMTRWSVTADGNDVSIATFHLSRPAFGDSPIVIQLRLSGPNLDPSSSGIRVTIPRLQPVHVSVGEEFVIARSVPPWSAELVQSSQVTVMAQSNTPLTGSSPLQLRFDGPQAVGTLIVAHKGAEYSANLESEIALTKSLTQVKYQLDLEWPGTQSDAVDVRWSALAGESLRWELPAGFQIARVGSDDDQNLSTETWRIRLPRKVGRRVRLIARWQNATADALNIPLPIVPEASTSSGQVILSYSPDLTVQAETTGLVSGSNVTSGRRGSSHADERSGTWRYGKDSPGLALAVTPNERLIGQDPWIATCMSAPPWIATVLAASSRVRDSQWRRQPFCDSTSCGVRYTQCHIARSDCADRDRLSASIRSGRVGVLGSDL